jgi:potassium/hydrogen antiporter
VVLATFAVLAGVEHSSEFFDIVFFSVLVSTLLQGATFEPLARRLGMTSEEREPPPSPIEVGTIRSLGAEVLECEIKEGDAAAGARIRDLDLPRGALVSLIVRDGGAITPRGSTRLRGGDRLYVLAGRSQSGRLDELRTRWREGPVGPPPRPAPLLRGSPPIFTTGPWTEETDGPLGFPPEIAGQPVIEVLRTRIDREGALLRLLDGRYVVTGERLAVGSARQLLRYCESRLEEAQGPDRDWLEDVTGALAAERGAAPRAR